VRRLELLGLRGARSRAEREVLRKARSGDWANLVEGDKPGQDLDDPMDDTILATPDLEKARWVRASFLRDLLTAEDDHVHPKGVRVRGARVTGKLDLEAVRGLRQLTLRGCWLDETPVFEQAELDWLELSCCQVPALHADQVSVKYSLVLARTRFSGDVRLMRASIEGLLDLHEVTLGSKDDEDAGTYKSQSILYADSIRVENLVRLDRLDAWGAVRLVGGVVAGTFYLRNAKVRFRGGVALEADRVDVSGDTILDRSRFKGAVGLRHAKIGGRLTCRGTRLSHPPLRREKDLPGEAPDPLHEAKVLLADQAEVGGDVRLSDGFKSMGCVSFLGATVSGSMVVDGATLTAIEPDTEPDEKSASHRHIAFDGEGMQVKSRLTWKPAEPNGYVDLRYANVHRLDDTHNAWPSEKEGKSYLTGLVYEELAHRYRTKQDLESRIAWLQRQRRYSSQPYEQLARFYRNSGHNRHADDVGVAREEARLGQLEGRDLRTRSYRAMLWVHRLTMGFGYKPVRAIVVLIVLFVATLVPLFVAEHSGWIEASKASEDVDVSRSQLKVLSSGTTQPTQPVESTTTTVASEQPDVLPKAGLCDGTYPCYSAFLYSAETVVPLINLRQAEYWTVSAQTVPAKVIRWWLGLSAILGWVLVTFTAGSALVARR
jgi:hypothetical protein